MTTYELLADLPVEVEAYELEALELQISEEFTRLSTVVRLRGGGHDGVGEDVTYEGLDQLALQEAGPTQDLAGRRTLGELCELIGSLDLFPAEPVREVSRLYRRWAFESAALDLALRQAGTSLWERLGREARPVTFVMSMRLDEPPSIEPITRRLESYPTLRFKLDPTAGWDDAFVAELAATWAVDSLDLKGFYAGTPVEVATDPALYRRVAEAFPNAWLEDPDLTPETEAVLREHRDRITWDAPIHSVADIEAVTFGDEALPPRMVNIKPSRFGSLEELCAGYDYCAEQGIGAYGGGQWELGPGRGQIQYLASVFHPDTPNDVAPTEYGQPDPPPGLPASPLEPRPSSVGFRWGES
jgi:L-alanine-DL-glutamate epimerase-like enolase superfamily enzyme